MPYLQRKAYGCSLPEKCCIGIDDDEKFGIVDDWTRQRWRMASIDEQRRMADTSACASNRCSCEGERKGQEQWLLRGDV